MDKDRVNEKIIYLKELLYSLKEMSKIERKEFVSDIKNYETTENLIRKSLQVMIDLSEDIVSKERLRSL